MGVFWTAADKPVPIDGLWSGGHVFLTCSGPSLANVDHDKLRHPGVMTLGCNNSPVVFRPNLWTMVDDVKNFCLSIYQDPRITKFLPHPKHKDRLWDNNKWEESALTPADCPNVLYYKRTGRGEDEWFRPELFFSQDVFNWGNHAQRCYCGYWRGEKDSKDCPQCGKSDRFGSRTVFLVMIRLAYSLGFRHLYLVGADFRMEKGGQNYAWQQSRSSSSVRNNNNTYRILNERMDALKPEMAVRGLNVYNCTPGSGLRSFPFMEFDDAIERALEWMPEFEHTDGLYDRKANGGRQPNQPNKPRAKCLQRQNQKKMLTLREFAKM